jgi:acetate kinase
MSGCILIFNAGSSSIKFALYGVEPLESLLFRGEIEEIGLTPGLVIHDAAGKKIVARVLPADLDHNGATREIFHVSSGLLRGQRLVAAGHRVVHGGTHYAAPVRVDSEVLAALAKLEPLAPLHQPHNLAPIRTLAAHAPDLPQVACFDTAFHRSQAPVAQAFAIPRALSEEGVRRYGFHGISYEYIVSRLREIAPHLAERRLILAHLGNGASLCAVRKGRSVANTMGFTAVEGLVMGTRCGAIDPGVLLYLMDTHGMDARALEDLIYRKSGLLGVSGISSDMRALRAARQQAADEAIALFVYRIVREIGSLAASLGGLDGLVFTAGIGENDKATRAEVAAGCGWLGLVLDEARNHAGEGRISAETSRVEAWVVPTDEERMIARHTASLLGLSASRPAAQP